MDLWLYLGVIEDAYIVPVSISYDKLVDGNFVEEQMVCMLCFGLVTAFTCGQTRYWF